MSAGLGLVGWLLTLVSLGTVAILRARLRRHTEAVARACHELRGALTAVRLGVELALRSRPLPAGRVRGLELELGRATLALEDLAAVRRRRSFQGRSRPRAVAAAEPVDVAAVVADTVEASRGAAFARGVSLEFNCADSGLLVAGERLRLAQAVSNLIANAIEHGGGAIEVSVRPARAMIRVEVVDGGPGLPAPIDRLAHGRRGRGGRGDRGHGLRIVGAIAAAHGGRLSAAPTDRGARIVLELPGLPPQAASRAVALPGRLSLDS